MAVRPKELKITAEMPWENDDLHRKEAGEALCAFIRTLGGPYVVALEGPWGSGKTTFLNRLEFALQLDGLKVPAIRVDAWRTDYLQDPMVAFIGAITSKLKGQKGKVEKLTNELIVGLAKNGAKLGGSLVSFAAKTFLPGSAEFFTALGEMTSKIGEELIEFQDEHAKSQAAFEELLIKARDTLTKRSAEQKITPIVFLVDELDRCRPDFAVRALERIKHFFDVPGIIFLIATDGENLPAAIAAVYGQKIDPEKYLRKFIDYEYHLPDPSPDDFVKYLFLSLGVKDLLPQGEDIDRLMNLRSTQSHEYQSNFGDIKFACVDVVAIFPACAKALKLTLRDQIQAFTIISCVLRSAPRREVIFVHLLCFLVCVRYSNPNLYEGVRIGRLPVTSLTSSNATELAIDGFLNSDPVGLAIRASGNCLNQENPPDRSSTFRQLRDNTSRQANAYAIETEFICAARDMTQGPRGSSRAVISNLLSLAERFAPAR